jgi:hypothetical protein
MVVVVKESQLTILVGLVFQVKVSRVGIGLAPTLMGLAVAVPEVPVAYLQPELVLLAVLPEAL